MPFLPSFRRPLAGALLLSIGLAISARSSRAEAENLLGYSYGSETEAKGHTEVYQWVTVRSGKAEGSYRATDLYTEIEHGFTDRLQGSLYLTAAHYHIVGVNELQNADRTVLTGGRVSLKYALRDPDDDGYGLSVYVEPEYSTVDKVPGDRIDEYGLETKLIFQKEYLRDRVIYLANVTAEPELAKERGETNHELGLEFSHGVSVHVAKRWYVGLENRWQAEFEPIRLSRWSHYATSLGPTVHFDAAQWWFTLSWMPQVTGWPATRHGLALDEYERNEYRLKFGLEF